MYHFGIISLFQVDEVELLDKRGYLTISLNVAREGKILLRKPEGIRDWFAALKVLFIHRL